MPKDSIKPIVLQTLDTSTIDAVAWTVVSAAGLEAPCFSLRITNTSGNVLFISFDGVNDHDVLLNNDHLDLSFQTNSRPGNQVAQLAKGTVIYVRGTPAVGNIHVSGWYHAT